MSPPKVVEPLHVGDAASGPAASLAAAASAVSAGSASAAPNVPHPTTAFDAKAATDRIAIERIVLVVRPTSAMKRCGWFDAIVVEHTCPEDARVERRPPPP